MKTINVFIPLYIYPLNEASWEPLHHVIRKNPQLRFLIVVNPHNGPGSSQLPDTNYLREIPKLSRHGNVVLLGYVHISYGRRPLPELIRDIEVYHGWTGHQNDHPGLQVAGIMVDEVPYHEDPVVLEYLEALTRLVRNWKIHADGITRAGTVVFNPGCVSSNAYIDLADISIVFEDTYNVLINRIASGILPPLLPPSRSGRLESCPPLTSSIHSGTYNPAKIGLLVHSISSNITDKEINVIIDKVAKIGSTIYLTEASSHFYESFSPLWMRWIHGLSMHRFL